jgi:hypothetical protein
MNLKEMNEAVGNNEVITMYRLANILSDVLGERIREQQLYNYRKNGFIKVNSSGRIAQSEAVKFVNEFVTKREARKAAKLLKEQEATEPVEVTVG